MTGIGVIITVLHVMGYLTALLAEGSCLQGYGGDWSPRCLGEKQEVWSEAPASTECHGEGHGCGARGRTRHH